MARCGIVARLGKAWKCAVWPGRVRRGVVWLSSMAWYGQARWCVARFGEAWYGRVWYGIVAR